MAEMDTSSGGGHKKGPGVKKAKKLSTRIDMTPMVDLGFLLITFFMFTTTMSKPKTMEINMPAKSIEPPTEIGESIALTLLLGSNHRVYYYEGLADNPIAPPVVKVAYFKPGKEGIREVILAKKKTIASLQETGQLSPKSSVAVLIKPDESSTYEDLVNAVDEMAINDVRTYAVIDITSVDKEFMGK